jgi:hypothetical protein
MMRRKPNHRLQKICGPFLHPNEKCQEVAPSPQFRSPVRASKHIQVFSTTLSHMQSMMHATATRIHHRHSVTYHMRHSCVCPCVT